MCTKNEQIKTDVSVSLENNDIPSTTKESKSEKMSEEEKKLRLLGRASEYFMFLDD